MNPNCLVLPTSGILKFLNCCIVAGIIIQFAGMEICNEARQGNPTNLKNSRMKPSQPHHNHIIHPVSREASTCCMVHGAKGVILWLEAFVDHFHLCSCDMLLHVATWRWVNPYQTQGPKIQQQLNHKNELRKCIPTSSLTFLC